MNDLLSCRGMHTNSNCLKFWLTGHENLNPMTRIFTPLCASMKKVLVLRARSIDDSSSGLQTNDHSLKLSVSIQEDLKQALTVSDCSQASTKKARIRRAQSTNDLISCRGMQTNDNSLKFSFPVEENLNQVHAPSIASADGLRVGRAQSTDDISYSGLQTEDHALKLSALSKDNLNQINPLSSTKKGGVMRAQSMDGSSCVSQTDTHSSQNKCTIFWVFISFVCWK